MENTESETWISDPYAAAWLLICGLEIVNTRLLNKKKAEYAFQHEKSTKIFLLHFYTGKACVNAGEFVEALRKVREIRSALPREEIRDD